jgi:hypothetical protein
LLKGKSTKRKGDEKGRWMELSGDSPIEEIILDGGSSSKMAVPRFDSRGYPDRNGEPSDAIPLRSISRGSMVSISTAGPAGGLEDDLDFSREYISWTPERSSVYYPEGEEETVGGESIYPPMSYSLSEASRDPYDTNLTGFGFSDPYGVGTGSHSGPLPSIYGSSKVSLASMRSEDSMSHFRRYDTMQDNYGAFSMRKKGGKRQLEEMVSINGC